MLWRAQLVFFFFENEWLYNTNQESRNKSATQGGGKSSHIEPQEMFLLNLLRIYMIFGFNHTSNFNLSSLLVP